MNARLGNAEAPGRRRRAAAGPAGRVLTQGLFLLAGLATTVLCFGWFVDANEVAGAYRTAPVCGTAAHTPGTDCVLRETGKVTARDAVNNGDSTDYTLTVARETAPKHSYPINAELYSVAKVGADVDLTVFRGRVAEVSYDGHRVQNPGTPWLASVEVALLAGLGTALTAHGLTWSRLGGRPASFFLAMGFFTALMALLGCLFFVTSPFPLAVTLAVPVLGWLFMTACATVATWDD
ncbi:hypothetical protein ACFVHB_17110 [Kitasatospora sp. NPDC127111]|uniref:hypothetical protein n=1 Tax=Kitasatospora sp. NPDC127111 TaxID=3345363 RepID=UPI00363130A5